MGRYRLTKENTNRSLHVHRSHGRVRPDVTGHRDHRPGVEHRWKPSARGAGEPCGKCTFGASGGTSVEAALVALSWLHVTWSQCLSVSVVFDPRNLTVSKRLGMLLGPSGPDSSKNMLEGLCLTSEAQSDRNRPAVARSTVADVLWSLVLPWSGEYVESTSGGRIWLEILDPERGAILIRRERSSSDPDPSVGRWVESLGVVFQGTAIEAVLDVAEGRVLGTHTGEEIRFADANGTIWRRGIVEGSSGSSGSSSSSSSSSLGAREQESAAREVLRLVLTQVLLSLRWEPTFLGLGVVGAGKAKAGDLVAIDAARRPLLSFLLRYAIGTHDLSFISEIYWSLWCLSQDYLDPNRAAYDKARWVLINALEGNIEFWDSIRGVQLDQWAIQNKQLDSKRIAGCYSSIICQ